MSLGVFKPLPSFLAFFVALSAVGLWSVPDALGSAAVTSPVWSPGPALAAVDGAGFDNFGGSVALSGNTTLIGAPYHDTGSGAAYVFVHSGSRWSQRAELIAADHAINTYFGGAVALSGNTAVIGATGQNGHNGAAYVFVRNGTTWSQEAELTAADGTINDHFGVSAALSGNTVVVGANFRNSATGAAYVFVRSGTTWSQQAELTATDSITSSNFGYAVALRRNTVVIGASDHNSVRGAAYVFVRSGTTWSQQQELDVVSGSNLGESAALSGNTAVVGASTQSGGTGAAYVFARGGATWSQQAELTAANGAGFDNFGVSVALSGNTAVVGANGHNNATGAAYVFVRTRF